PLFEQWPTASHRLLFDTLPLENKPQPPMPPQEEGAGFRRRRSAAPLSPGVNVMSNNAEEDADRLLRRFLEATHRHPAMPADMDRFQRVIRSALDAQFSFADAMIAGYTA